MSENLDVSIDKKITEKSEVIMHLDIRLKDGSIAESSRKMEKPLSFKMGEKVFSDKFESEILGLKAGTKKKIMLILDTQL